MASCCCGSRVRVLDETDGDGIGRFGWRPAHRRPGCGLEFSEIGLILANRERAETSRKRRTMPTTSCVSTPRGIILSERFLARPEGLRRSRFECFDVAVVHRSRFGEDFLLGHRGEHRVPRYVLPIPRGSCVRFWRRWRTSSRKSSDGCSLHGHVAV